MISEKTYTVEDLKQAFEDGKRYGDNELELDTAGRLTAFEVWIENYLAGKIKKSEVEEPYLYSIEVRTIRDYNRNYGADRICECGHPYYRHFDTYEDMYPCGCKYCECREFKEDDGTMKKFDFFKFNMRTYEEEKVPTCTIEATNPDIAENIFNDNSDDLYFTPTDEIFYHIRRRIE